MKRPRPLRATLMRGVLLCTFLATSPVSADSTSAARAFREGREALKAGDVETACSRFRASEDSEPSSGARLNLGDCATRRNDYVEAERLYRAAALLAEGEKRTFAEQKAASARSLAATLHLTWSGKPPNDAYVEVDGRALDVPGDIVVNPGRHTITVSTRGRGASPTTAEAVGGRTTNVSLATDAFTLEPTPVTVHPAVRGPIRRSLVPYVLLGAGAASLAFAGASAFLAMSARDDLDTKCASAKPCNGDIWRRPDVQSDFDRAQTWALVSTVATAAGALSLAAGGTWLVIVSPRAAGATASLSARF